MSGSIFDWSTTASNNDSADGDINWTEGQNAKTVNNSARQMMGRVAEILLDIGGQGTVGGTANAITLTLNSAFTGLKSGLICSLKPTADNTGAVTLNVNGIGAKSIRKFDVSGEVALASGDLQAGSFYSLVYDSSANSAAGAWICLNPTLASVTGPASATDGDIMVADGTSGRAIKDSGSKVSDLMPKSGGTFTGSVNATTITSTGGAFVGAAASVVVAPSAAGGTVYLRPEGAGETEGQITITKTGGLHVDGPVTSSQNFSSSGTAAVLTTGSAGTIWLEPNPNSATGATKVLSNGNMTVAGSITAGGVAVPTTASDIGELASGLSAGAVGTYAFAQTSGASEIKFGDTVAGSSLFPVGVAGGGGMTASSTALSGTWRCMGYAPTSAGKYATLYLRIA